MQVSLHRPEWKRSLHWGFVAWLSISQYVRLQTGLLKMGQAGRSDRQGANKMSSPLQQKEPEVDNRMS